MYFFLPSFLSFFLSPIGASQRNSAPGNALCQMFWYSSLPGCLITGLPSDQELCVSFDQKVLGHAAKLYVQHGMPMHFEIMIRIGTDGVNTMNLTNESP